VWHTIPEFSPPPGKDNLGHLWPPRFPCDSIRWLNYGVKWSYLAPVEDRKPTTGNVFAGNDGRHAENIQETVSACRKCLRFD
jgi:hypothetical protein